MHPTFGLTSRAVCTEIACTQLVQDGFRHDRTSRIAGAKEKHVVGVIGHGAPHAVDAGAVRSRSMIWCAQYVLHARRCRRHSPCSPPWLETSPTKCQMDLRSTIFPTWRNSSWFALVQ